MSHPLIPTGAWCKGENDVLWSVLGTARHGTYGIGHEMARVGRTAEVVAIAGADRRCTMAFRAVGKALGGPGIAATAWSAARLHLLRDVGHDYR